MHTRRPQESENSIKISRIDSMKNCMQGARVETRVGVTAIMTLDVKRKPGTETRCNFLHRALPPSPDPLVVYL